MKIDKISVEKIACGKTSASTEIAEIAKNILDRGLFNSFTSYAEKVYGNESSLEDCMLDYAWNGAKINVDVSDTSYPGGKLEFYGMTPDESFKNMMEAIDDNPELIDLLSGKIFTVRGDDKKYMLVGDGDQRYLTSVDMQSNK